MSPQLCPPTTGGEGDPPGHRRLMCLSPPWEPGHWGRGERLGLGTRPCSTQQQCGWSSVLCPFSGGARPQDRFPRTFPEEMEAYSCIWGLLGQRRGSQRGLALLCRASGNVREQSYCQFLGEVPRRDVARCRTAPRAVPRHPSLQPQMSAALRLPEPGWRRREGSGWAAVAPSSRPSPQGSWMGKGPGWLAPAWWPHMEEEAAECLGVGSSPKGASGHPPRETKDEAGDFISSQLLLILKPISLST